MGIKEDHGALYYRLSEKTKKKGRPHHAFYPKSLRQEILELLVMLNTNRLLILADSADSDLDESES